MKKEIPIWIRVLAAVVIFFSSIGVYASVSSAGKEMVRWGYEMADIRSQAGNTIAEYYYQIHGEIYVCLGTIISNAVAVVLITGIFVAVWLAYPIIEYISKIKSNDNKFGEAVQCSSNKETEKTEPAEDNKTMNN